MTKTIEWEAPVETEEFITHYASDGEYGIGEAVFIKEQQRWCAAMFPDENDLADVIPARSLEHAKQIVESRA